MRKRIKNAVYTPYLNIEILIFFLFSLSLSLCVSVCMFLFLPVCMYACLCMYVFLRVFVCVYAWANVCTSICCLCLSECMYVYMTVCLYVCSCPCMRVRLSDLAAQLTPVVDLLQVVPVDVILESSLVHELLPALAAHETSGEQDTDINIH